MAGFKNIITDESPIDVTREVNFIWSVANKLRGTYQSDKYKDVIIPRPLYADLNVLLLQLSTRL